MIAPGAAALPPALARDATAIVVLLERFGDLLVEALDAAGRGEDEDFAVAIAERTRVTVALGHRLAALAVARQVARRDGLSDAQIAAILHPVDEALRHAQLLHDRIADEPDPIPVSPSDGRAVLALVR